MFPEDVAAALRRDRVRRRRAAGRRRARRLVARRLVGELVERRVPPQAHSRPLFDLAGLLEQHALAPLLSVLLHWRLGGPRQSRRRLELATPCCRLFVLLARRELALHARGHRKVVLGPFHGLVLLPLELEGQARVVALVARPRAPYTFEVRLLLEPPRERLIIEGESLMAVVLLGLERARERLVVRARRFVSVAARGLLLVERHRQRQI